MNNRRQHANILLIEFTGSVVETKVEALLHVLRDTGLPQKSVCSIMLRINSNGGSLGAAQSFAEGLLIMKAELGVPLRCFVGEQALSAAFYVALSADQLVVNRSALLASVGAVREHYSIVEQATRVGVDVQTFSSGVHKSAMNPFSKVTVDQESAVQETPDETASHFIEWIKPRRPTATLGASQLDGLSSIVTGARCINLNLADREGGLFAALDRAGKLGNTDSPGLLRVNLDERAEQRSLQQRIIQFAFEKVFVCK